MFGMFHLEMMSAWRRNTSAASSSVAKGEGVSAADGAGFEGEDSLSTPCLPPFDGLRGRTLRLHFKLRAAELFSFWFE